MLRQDASEFTFPPVARVSFPHPHPLSVLLQMSHCGRELEVRVRLKVEAQIILWWGGVGRDSVNDQSFDVSLN